MHMNMTRMALALAALLLVAGLAYVGQQSGTAAPDMVAAAQGLLDSLTPEQKAKAGVVFDSKERYNWNFVPLQDKEKHSTRKGLPLEDMTPEQKKAALALLRAGTSEQGNLAAVTIMSLEGILRDQEKGGAMVRNPEWYFFTIFGTPSKTGSWGWRVEGHHLSLNFTLEGTQIVSATPHFFGANPAEIKSGPKKGVRPLEPTEELAFALFKSLDTDQAKIAHREKPFGEPGQNTIKPSLAAPEGLSAAKMTASQKDTLSKLLKAYTDRMRPEIGALELKRALGELEQVHFAFTGSPEQGKGHTYRVQGKTFVIEFLNMQADSAGNAANHIHSAWRHIEGDFGKEKS
jgi:hypothetical protein